jgi:hypothetical protein
MYRAIRDVNWVCAQAERNRRYLLHRAALARIEGGPARRAPLKKLRRQLSPRAREQNAEMGRAEDDDNRLRSAVGLLALTFNDDDFIAIGRRPLPDHQ